MKPSDQTSFKIVPLRLGLQLTRTQKKIIEAKNAIYFQPQPDADDMAFSARELVQATLPHQTPRGNPPEWVRRNGNRTSGSTGTEISGRDLIGQRPLHRLIEFAASEFERYQKGCRKSAGWRL